jgi:dipeptide/tripeptide permease
MNALSPWLSFGVGSLLIAAIWFRYYKSRESLRPSFSVSVGVTVTGLMLIGVGVWELFR